MTGSADTVPRRHARALRTLPLAGALSRSRRRAAPRPQAQVIKLATLVPEGSVWDKSMREMGADWAASHAGPRHRCASTPAASRATSRTWCARCASASCRPPRSPPRGSANIDPAFNVFNIPMFFTSYPELYATLDKLEPVLRKRARRQGLRAAVVGARRLGVLLHQDARSRAVDGLKQDQDVHVGGRRRDGERVEGEGLPARAARGHRHHDRAADGHDRLLPDHAAARAHAAVVPPDAEHGRHGHGAAGGRAGDDQGRRGRRSRRPTSRRSMAACAKLQKRLEVEVPRQDTTAVVEMQKRGLKVNAVIGSERRAVPRHGGAVRRAA